MNTLRIDTSDNLVTRVELETSRGRFELEEKRGKPGDQNVLEMIEKILAEHTLKLEKVNSIQVKTGPGSFTGLRVGVSIANALSFALKAPVNSKKLGELAEPTY